MTSSPCSVPVLSRGSAMALHIMCLRGMSCPLWITGGTTSTHVRADLTCMPGKSGETSGRRGSAAKPKKIRPGPIWRGEQLLITVFRHHFYHRARSIAIPGYAAAYLEVKLHDRCPMGERRGRLPSGIMLSCFIAVNYRISCL